MDLYSEHDRIDDLDKLMNRKLSDYFENLEAQGNINYHLGLLYSALNKDQKAKKLFETAKECFTGTIESNHNVFKLIEENVNRIKTGHSDNS